MTGQVILLNGGSYSNSGSIVFTNNSLESTSPTNPGDITNSGSIVATDQSGTAVYLEDGGEVTNNAGATIGSSTTGGDGILTGPDTGATTVTNDGSIYGVNGTAVSLAGDGTLSNDDLIQGDSGVSIAGVGKMVTNNKTITATTGIGVSIGDGGTVVNATGAAISGGSGGISIASGSGTSQGTVTNSGSIVATDQSGTAVYLEDGGEVTNNAGAAIGSSTTGGDGILTGPDTGAATVTNDGSIYGVNGTAVSLAGEGTLSNDDLIQGDSGVSIAGVGKIEVTNNKTITATTGIGVSIGNGGTVVNATGAAISGGSGGISIASGSGTSQGTVTNSGSIVATDQSGTAVYLEDGGEVTNNAGATIGSSTTGGDGILTGPDTGATTVTNDGSIYGVNGTAVSLAGDGTVSNDDLIQGDSGLSIAGVGKMVTNNKTITATTGIGVSIGDGGTVVNANGAAISGGSGGISIASGSGTSQGTVTNSGSIVATDQSGTAVYLEDGGEVMNNAGATIGSSTTGGDGILTGPDTGATTVTNDGSIYGVNGTAVSLAGEGTLSNDDLIQGDSGVSIAGVGKMVTNNKTITATTGIGVSIGNGGTVVNATGAAISGGSGGISIASGSGTSQGTVTNSGSIVATDQSGTAVYLEDGGEVTNNAGATIGSSTTGGDGILTGPDTGATTVTNDGSIYGVNGTAVSLAGEGTLSNDDLIQGDSGVSIAGVGKMVTNNKTITATTGIGVSIGDGGTVVNANGAAISGGSGGISIASGSGTSQGTVTNSGSIVATDQSGTAVFLEDGGEVTNNAGAAIGSSTTGGDGILTGPDTGETTVTNFGTINGDNGAAISLAGDGDIINNGTIAGATGVSIAGEGNVIDYGSISGAQGVGIDLSGDAFVYIGPLGLADGQPAAVTNAGNTPGLVVNLGAITAHDADGKGVEFNLLGGAIANVGAISGLDNGVDSDGLTIIANAGAITGGIGAGVEIGASGVVETTGSILGSEGVSIAQLGQVTNIALITATLQAGVSIGYGGEALNIGKIIGVTDGVEIAGAPGSVTNIGSISASAAAGVGVSIEDGGSVSNAAGGASISGADTGVEGGAGTTVSNKGSISGKGGEGVSISGAGSVTSSHSISGAAGVAIDGQGEFSNSGTITASDTTAVSLGEGGSAVNGASAVLSGVTGGLVISDDAGEAVNLGSIKASGSTSYGVELAAGGSLDNGSGAVITGGEYGVLAEGGVATIQNDGSISGAIGVDLGAGGTLVNAGTIASSAAASGVAVQLAGSDCTVIEDAGATLTGGVGGFAAGDVIELGVDPTVVNGYETSPGPNGMTTLTLTANGAAVASINLVGSVGTTFSIYQTPGSSYIEITLGAVSTTVNVSTFDSQQSSLNQTSGGFDISDTESDLVGGLNALNSDAAHIDWISATNAAVTVNVATELADRAALDKVLGGYSISDQAGKIQQNFASLAADTAHISAIVALNGPVTVSVAALEADEAALNEIVGGFAVSDTASAISGELSELQADAGDILSVTATGGKVLVDAADVGPDQAILAKIGGGYRISGLSADDQINLPSLAYESSYQAAFFARIAGGTLEILDPSAGGKIVATLKLAQAAAGLVSLAADLTEGTDISVESDPLAQPAEGDVLISDIRGQAYSAYQNNYVSGTYTGVSYFYTQPPSGATYSDYQYDYSAGGAFIGSRFFYPAASGADYSGAEYDYDGAGKLVRALFTGVTGQLYSSYAYNYVGGVLAGSEFNYTEVPSSAGYSSYTIDYGADGAFAGEEFFFDNIAGQSYTGEEEDFDPNVKLSRVVLTGVENQAYSSLELDYSAGTYEGYEAFYVVSGRPYTNEEVDVSASGQLEKVVYSGMTSTPYSSVEQDYSGGSLADTIYGYTDVAGQTYSAYQVKEGASGNPLTEIFDLDSGGHTQLALASGQMLTSAGGDRMTGSSTGSTTFVLNAVYGADTITNLTSADMVSLPSSEFANFAALQAAAARSGANVEITASDGDTLTLKNMTLATLAGMSSHFTFLA